MNHRILGLHHITAISDNAKRNLHFYTHVLGLRLVKKTVNFDDPTTYHFYFGDEQGTPGTIITFFPWEGIGRGKNGAGMATHTAYSIPKSSFTFWKERLEQQGLPVKEDKIFGEDILSFSDPDGLQLQFIASDSDTRTPWTTTQITNNEAIKGFHSVTLTLRAVDATAKILTDVLGYSLTRQDGNRYRFTTDAIDTAHIVDVIEDPAASYGRNAAGTNHHIAFRVENDDILMDYREKVLAAGLNITPKIDRDYFFSLYFREPGGVLFELATDNPGFTRDESLENLGTALKLPKQYANMRERIERALPPL
ncbi:MAG TPA: ring-cleaving dioxygenase [Porphyromonadaceae bacterium]|jgi:glyoxalase family protein|nr:ring-cleaving dioxygenase [Porphyromonadaceae bacterium]HBK30797.1 ring-cleaving dioxygenase [Porphyromonadaceae bacterium]HBL34758.1 ring-cleaving dioxygenase [Porphyromonadaceae bacterium]HBX21399.1 ring-cleaving dioxygenase [Porphyromonadaceae bacterium]HCM21894.1 ring-cleaving dioxygenase [Porphyromonadaceae bacterium]